MSMLEYGERCEIDGVYGGSAPEFVKRPKAKGVLGGNRDMQQRVRNRQARVNKQLKNWAI